MNSEIPSKGKLVTREELYVQVWQTPMSKLAGQYGVSDSGLRKICDRLNVPYPARGYWAKKAAGYNVTTRKLPTQKENTPKGAYIRATSLNKKVRPEVKAAIAEMRLKNPRIHIPKRLVKPHPIIGKWLKENENQWAQYRREFDPVRRQIWKPEKLTGTDKRIHLILQGLFNALEAKGGKIKQNDRGGLAVEFKQEEVEFNMREKLKQIYRPLTEEEKESVFYRDRTTMRELVPTGCLVFTIRTWLPENMRHEWVESSNHTMEDMLADIVATILAAIPLFVARRKQEEEEKRQSEIKRQQRLEEERYRKQEDDRWQCFINMANIWQEVETARRFLSKLKQMPRDDSRELGDKTMEQWIRWAEEQLDLRNPMNQRSDKIWKLIAQVTRREYI